MVSRLLCVCATGIEGLAVLDQSDQSVEHTLLQTVTELARGRSHGSMGAVPEAARKSPRDSASDWEPTGKNMPAIPRRVAEKN